MSNQRDSFVDQAYKIIKDNIINGVYEPEQRLYETTLAEEMGMSRQPIRMALLLLNEEGWFSSFTQRNIRVQGVFPQHIDELYEARRVLERAALHEIFERQVFWTFSFELEEYILRMRQNIENRAAVRKAHYEFYYHMLDVFTSPLLKNLYIKSGAEQLLRINIMLAPDGEDLHSMIEESTQLVTYIRENMSKEAEELYLSIWDRNRRKMQSLLSTHHTRKETH